MTSIVGKVESVYIGSTGSEFTKDSCASVQAELDGLVGDRHRSIQRQSWAGDKQAEGTIRRNERQWSAVSVEELAFIQQEMDLDRQLTAADLGANLCLVGVPKLSQCLGLYLAYALSSYTKLLSYLFQGAAAAVLQAES